MSESMINAILQNKDTYLSDKDKTDLSERINGMQQHYQKEMFKNQRLPRGVGKDTQSSVVKRSVDSKEISASQGRV